MKLPLKASVDYFASFLSAEESESLFQRLRLAFYNAAKSKDKDDRAFFLGRIGKIMFMDEDLYKDGKLPRNIWGETGVWPTELLSIKQRVESKTKTTFQVCVCIFYPDGEEGVSYHSDLSAFGNTNTISSISLGEERLFLLREKGQSEEFELLLKSGSLLVMGEKCQDLYEHSLPINSKYKNERINLTFRQYGYPD